MTAPLAWTAPPGEDVQTVLVRDPRQPFVLLSVFARRAATAADVARAAAEAMGFDVEHGDLFSLQDEEDRVLPYTSEVPWGKEWALVVVGGGV